MFKMDDFNMFVYILKPVLRIRILIRWIHNILASWIKIRIQGTKYQPKTVKNIFILKLRI